MFNNVQEALNQPSSTVARSLVMSDAQNLIDQMDRLAGIVSEQKAVVNEQLEPPAISAAVKEFFGP